MAPSQLSQYLLYTAASISAASVAGHTQMGYEVVFPSLKRITVTAAGKKHDDGAVAAKIGWLEGNQVFGIMGAFLIFLTRPVRRGRGKRGRFCD
jgi:hypothetical protein